MSLGLKRGIVQLEPHDKQWDEAAIQTIKNLKSILGDDAVDIQHIGSTAIPDKHIETKYGLGTIRNLSSGCKTLLNIVNRRNLIRSII